MQAVDASILTHTADDQAGCCSVFYEQDWVRKIAEDNFHPGGEELTQRTIEAMNLPAHAHIVDLGCGTGTTSIALARDSQLTVSAIDRSVANISRACERARELMPPDDRGRDRLRFIPADAVSLPFPDHSLDAILAECSFSLFPDKAAALTEIRRVLKPGGQFGITDMAVERRLPDDIDQVIAPWTCLTDAPGGKVYLSLFAKAGFTVIDAADESAGLTMLISNLKRKLLLIGAGSVLSGVHIPDLDVGRIKYWLDRFASEVESGAIRYLRFNLRTG
jgi:SAM-dependent methyltransferase